MTRRQLQPHPCLPVPLRERQRLAVAAHQALAHAVTGDPLSLADLHAAAHIVLHLADPARLDGADDARQAAREALQALDDAEHGVSPHAALPARCAGAVDAFEQLLGLVTWRRLCQAQDAAR